MKDRSESGIWWTESWNPIVGCRSCSPGCDRCWARKWVHRAASNPTFVDAMGNNDYRLAEPWDGTLVEFPERWRQPLHWRRPQRIFVGSQSDIALWPLHHLAHVLDVMCACPQHRFLLLTKRPALLDDSMAELDAGFGPNTWLGVTCCTQAEVDAKIPALLPIPAAHHWLCLEPLLGPVDVAPHLIRLIDDVTMTRGFRAARVELLIVGGESGLSARPCQPQWVRQIRDDCRAAGVAMWLKQWSSNSFWPFDCEADAGYWLVGETTLDGRQHHELPAGLRLPGER